MGYEFWCFEGVIVVGKAVAVVVLDPPPFFFLLSMPPPPLPPSPLSLLGLPWVKVKVELCPSVLDRE